MRQMGIWQEITTLIVPGLNDSEGELKDIANFIVSVGKEIPWHISRFHPEYKLDNLFATPVVTLQKAREIGKKAGLRYVYLGNVPSEGENTICYKCGKLLIRRYGFEVLHKNIKDSKCSQCFADIDGVQLS